MVPSIFPTFIFAILSLKFAGSVDEICPQPWARYGKLCYYFSTNQTSWLQAEKFCRSQNAVLASVDTEGKANFLLQFMSVLSGAGRTSYWNGGNDLVHTNEWRWLDSGKPINKTFWTQDSPTGNPGFDCIIMDYSITNTSNWRDNPCEYTWFYFICQKPVNSTLINKL